MNQCYLLGLSNFKADHIGYTVEKERIMFIYRLKYLDGSTAEVTASRDTIILLETLIKYGIIKRITAKS